MFGLGASEMVLIGIVALIVIGPKDLPGMFRTIGQFTGKARGMAREFSRAMEAAADESGIKDVSKTLRAASDPKAFGTEALKNATGFGKDPIKAPAAAKDPLANDPQEAAARAKVPASPAAAPAQAAPKTAAKPAPAAKPAAAKPAATSAAKPATAAKPKRSTPKPASAKPEDQA